MNLNKPALNLGGFGPASLNLDWLSVKQGLLLWAPFQTSGDYYSIANGKMESLATETVDADGTQRSWGGQIIQATANTARAQPGRGVLIEGARTNLCLRSQELDVGGSGNPWLHTNVTIVANQAVSPDGSQNAEKVSENTADNFHTCRQDFTVTNGVTYAWSLFAHADTLSSCGLIIGGTRFGGALVAATFTLSGAGAVITQSGGLLSAGIKNVGGGWYRIRITDVCTSTGTELFYLALCQADGTTYYTGTEASIFAYGAQLEAGTSPSSYIPTTSGSVERAADVLAFVAANHASASAGSIILAMTPLAATQTGFLLDLSADGDNEFWLKLNSGKPEFKIERATTGQADLTATSAIAKDATGIIGIAWDDDDVRLYADGGDEKTDTSATMPASINASIFLGCDISSGSQVLATYRHILAYDRALAAGEFAVVSAEMKGW